LKAIPVSLPGEDLKKFVEKEVVIAEEFHGEWELDYSGESSKSIPKH
jgi:hypothetical protein